MWYRGMAWKGGMSRLGARSRRYFHPSERRKQKPGSDPGITPPQWQSCGILP